MILYTCPDGSRIDKRWLCDGDEDCVGGADERDCGVLPLRRSHPGRRRARSLTTGRLSRCSDGHHVPLRPVLRRQHRRGRFALQRRPRLPRRLRRGVLPINAPRSRCLIACTLGLLALVSACGDGDGGAGRAAAGAVRGLPRAAGRHLRRAKRKLHAADFDAVSCVRGTQVTCPKCPRVPTESGEASLGADRRSVW